MYNQSGLLEMGKRAAIEGNDPHVGGACRLDQVTILMQDGRDGGRRSHLGNLVAKVLRLTFTTFGPRVLWHPCTRGGRST